MAAAVHNIPESFDAFFYALYEERPNIIEERHSTTYSLGEQSIEIVTDRHQECHIDVKRVDEDTIERTHNAIQTLLEALKESHAFNILWVDFSLPIKGRSMALVLPSSFQIGNTPQSDMFRDDQENKVRYWQVLNPHIAPSCPHGALHTIEITALVVDTTAIKVLLIVDTDRPNEWNLPLGTWDLSKDTEFELAGFRVAMEAAGLPINEQECSHPHFLTQKDFPNTPFTPTLLQAWSYAVDGLSQRPLPSPLEGTMLRVQWIRIDTVLQSPGKTFSGIPISQDAKALIQASPHSSVSRALGNFANAFISTIGRS